MNIKFHFNPMKDLNDSELDNYISHQTFSCILEILRTDKLYDMAFDYLVNEGKLEANIINESRKAIINNSIQEAIKHVYKS